MQASSVLVNAFILSIICEFPKAERLSDNQASYFYQREHPEENSGRFEGDIIVDRRTRDQLLGNVPKNWARDAITGNSNLWPGGTMYYTLDSGLPSRTRSVIQRAMTHIISSTQRCIKFKRRRRNQRDYVRFFRGRGCYSYIGRRGGRQDISIGAGCDSKLGTPVHEILHALGFFHEQSRRDRDQFITVHFENIRTSARNNFRVHPAGRGSTLGLPYDYDSVMHYSRFAFSRNGKSTIVPKQAGARIGQRERLSKIDIEQVRKLYGCSR